MELRKVVAIIRTQTLEEVEGRLVDLGVKGISVTKVKGFGEYANFFKPDWMVSHARLEVFSENSRVPEIVTAIMEMAHTGMPGDGIVAVLPVEGLYRIRTKAAVTAEEL